MLARNNIFFRSRTYDQTQQVAENGDRGRDDPRKDPKSSGNAEPRADSDPVALVHAVCSGQQPDVDVFHCNVAVDNSGDDNLACFIRIVKSRRS